MAGMNGHKTIAVLVGLLALLAKPVLAEQRVALVIGNANYAHATRLANPLNDAADIGDALARLGFQVTKLENADYAALRQGLLAFTKAAAAAEVAVVFYAGHGIEVDQRNFLVPVDARLTSDQDVEYEAVPLELVTRSVARASGLRLVILDACRENPFAVAMQRSGATRSVGRGLARIEPAGETLVAYASKEGTVAADGEGRNSPYSTALLAHLEEPGLEIGLMFRKVRDAVLASTGGRQEPFVYGSLSSRGVYLMARTEPDPAPSPPPPTSLSESVSERLTAEELAAERVFWESVKDSANAADFEAYLSHYPQGRFALLARNRLAALQQPSTPPALPELTPESVEAGLELSRADRRLVQLGLAAQGFDPGPADGLFGRGSRGAIGRWQASRGEASTGYLDAEAAKALLASGRKREAEEREAEARTRREAQEKAADDAAYEQAKSSGTVESYEAYLSAYPSGRHTEEARRLLAEARERSPAEALAKALATAQGIENGYQRKQAFIGITRVQAEAGRYGDALATTQRVEEGSGRARAFVIIARAQAKTGDSGDAEKSFSKAASSAAKLERGFSRVLAFIGIARAQAEAGRVQDAEQSITEALATARREEHVHSFTSIAEAQAELGHLQDAEETLSEAILAARRAGESGGTAPVYDFSNIAITQAKVGNVRDAKKSFSRALAIARSEDEDDWKYTLLGKVAKSQVEAGQFHDALETAQMIEDDSRQESALHRISIAQAEAGQFRDALETVQRIDEKSKRDRAFASIAEGQATTGDVQDALLTARSIGDVSLRGRAFDAIAGAQARAGRIQVALATAQSIKDASYRGAAIAAVVSAQLQAGDVLDALATAQKIEEDASYRGHAFTWIAEAQAEAGNVRDAEKSLSEALSTVPRIDESDRDSVLANIAEAQAAVAIALAK